MAIPTEIATTTSDHLVLIQDDDDDELSVVSFELDSDKGDLNASVVSLDPLDGDFVGHSSGRWDESNSSPDLMSSNESKQTQTAQASATAAAPVAVEGRKTQPRRKNAPRRDFNKSCSSILSNSSDGLSKLKRSSATASAGEDASMGLSSSRHEARERRTSLQNLRKSLSNRNLMSKMEDNSMGLSSSRHSCRRSSLITPPQRPQRNDSMLSGCCPPTVRSRSHRNLLAAAAASAGAPQRPSRLDSFGPGQIQQQMVAAAAME